MVSLSLGKKTFISLYNLNASFNSIGYLVSASVPSVSVALAIGPVSFIPFLLFGGFFIRSGTV